VKDRKLPSRDVAYEVEQFLFWEARLLDETRYDDWLNLLTKDFRYWVPVRETSDNRDSDIRGEHEMAFFDDDLEFMKARVQRFHSGFAHAETPASRTRRVISNVEVQEKAKTLVKVFCNFIIYQTRLEQTEAVYVGCREDVLKRFGSSWKIRNRTVLLDQTLLPRTISIIL